MVLSLFTDILMAKAGLDPNAIGLGVIKAAVMRRMEQTGSPGESSYLIKLRTDPAELESLVVAVTVPETWFFREPGAFTFLKSHLETEWLPKHRGEMLRILSLPCCTGEEPFSIAMSLLDIGLGPKEFIVEAFDINPAFLEKALLREYSANSFRGGDLMFRQKYFQQDKGRYFLNPEVAQPVCFEKGNLLSPDFLLSRPKYPAIFCRNLLIYLHSSAQKQVLGVLDQCLERDGLLFTGHAETVTLPGYRPVEQPMSFAYRRLPPPRAAGITSQTPAAPERRIDARQKSLVKDQPLLPVSTKIESPAPKSNPSPKGSSAGCWDDIGVKGDKSCTHLPQVIHCRNCETFTAAARKAFARTPPAGYREEWAKILAARQEPRPELQVSLLIFRLGSTWLALPARLLQRIDAAQTPHRIPHSREVLQGLAYVEGEFRLCWDLAKVLGIARSGRPEDKSNPSHPRIILARHKGQDWAFLAEEVLKIASWDCGRIKPAGPGHAVAKGLLVYKGKDVMLLDEELLAASFARGIK